MLSGVVAARRRRYVMMNATTETLPAIRAVLPSMGAPTVLSGRRGGDRRHAAVAADDVGHAAGAAGRRCHLDPRAARSSGSCREGRRARRGDRRGGADRRRRARSGDAAVLEWTERFDGPRTDGFRVSRRDRRGSVGRRARGAAAMIRASPSTRPSVPSTRRSRRPRDRLGAALAPPRLGRGLRAERTFPLPSSLVMTAVPLVAGVRRIAVVTPDRSTRPSSSPRARARRGLRHRRRPGGGGARLGTRRSGRRQDRRAGERIRHRREASRLEPRRIDLPAGPSEVDRDRRRDRRRPPLCGRPAGPGRARRREQALLLSTDRVLTDAAYPRCPYDNVTVEPVTSPAERWLARRPPRRSISSCTSATPKRFSSGFAMPARSSRRLRRHR